MAAPGRPDHDAGGSFAGRSVSFQARNAPVVVPSLSDHEAPRSPGGIILPKRPILMRRRPQIIEAERPLSEEEANREDLPEQEELDRLSRSLAPNAEEEEGSDAEGESFQLLGSLFDGPGHEEEISPDQIAPVAAYFAMQTPRAPDLVSTGKAAKAVVAALFPKLFKDIPTRIVSDRSQNPQTGHVYEAETGHRIEVAPLRLDERGMVESELGIPGMVKVQERIEMLIEVTHEYAHVLFDDLIGRQNSEVVANAAFRAMTEGFAVAVEQMAIDRLLARPAQFGIGPEDAGDLVRLAQGRRHWLQAFDNHYSEGIVPWRKVFEAKGERGLLEFASSLSAKRLMTVRRSDPAYQLAASSPEMLQAYLGEKGDRSLRAGLEAFEKHAQGEEISEAEQKAAARAIEAAGPEGRRRVFERFLMPERAVLDREKGAGSAGQWWSQEAPQEASLAPAFSLASLSAVAAQELIDFLLEMTGTDAQMQRVFEASAQGVNRNSEIISRAESLPWDELAAVAWAKHLERWFTRALL